MEELLKSFTAGYLLRTLSGAFFVISYRVAVAGWRDALKPPSAEEWIFALFVGIFCYTLYRTGVYPLLIENTFDCRRFRKWRNNGHTLISKDTMERLLDRWRRNSPGIDANEAVGKHFVTWADYTHLLYASSVCIALGAIAGAVVNGPSELVWDWRLIVFAIMLLVLAVFSDWRLRALEDCSTEKYPQPPLTISRDKKKEDSGSNSNGEARQA
jgi:hypothetical protein